MTPTRRKSDFKFRVPEDGSERRFYQPSVMQVRGAVKGDDRYVYRKPFPWGALILLGFAIGGLLHVLGVL